MKKGEYASGKIIHDHGPLGFVMFVAFIGALIYFLQKAQDFGDILFAFIQALVWPGFIVYHVLKLFGA